MRQRLVFIISLLAWQSPAQTIHFTHDPSGNLKTRQTNALAADTLRLKMKVFLAGCYQNGAARMSDSLRVKGLLPTTEPYTGLPGFQHQNGGGGETVAPSVLAVAGLNAVVDWVFVEIRDPEDSTLVLATRAALLQRDGDVTETDGVSPLQIYGFCPDAYWVSIRHRNHLGAMSGAPVPLSRNAGATLDFTNPATLVFGTNARRIIGTKACLWAGDANGNRNVRYNGANNDKSAILQTVGPATPNNIVNGYLRSDANMDGKVKYNGAKNDKNTVLNNVGLSSPSHVLVEQLPQ